MKKIFVLVLFAFVMACAHDTHNTNETVQTVQKQSGQPDYLDYLKYGTRASVIEKAWGKPDETMAYQDYRAKGYHSVAGIGGSWDSQSGSVRGFSVGETYTPTTIVWIYKEKGKVLFFEKRGLLDERRTLIMLWKLVGWDNLKPEKTSLGSDKIEDRKKYAERRINEVGITSDADIKIFWALMEKAPKEMVFEDKVDWSIKRTKEIK
jgi:hypothetical protein